MTKPFHWIILFVACLAAAWIIIKTGNSTPRYEKHIDLNWYFTNEDNAAFSSPEHDHSHWETQRDGRESHFNFSETFYEDISYHDNSLFNMETFLAGQFIWAGIDYPGESMGWPDRGLTNGLLETKDIAHIKTSVTDIAGTKTAKARELIRYLKEGPEKSRAIDNGNLADHTRFELNEKTVSQEDHILIVQSTIEPIDLIIKATNEGIEPTEINLKSIHKNNKDHASTYR
ncbi:MAG TPA: hypothetical protein VJ951_14030 [Bacteroidales bacterium]|nr:hypothetical protein [Bacteroidales bacterium]